MAFPERIRQKFHELSEAQQKVARFLLEHPDECAKGTAMSIGNQVGVSEATVIRFCQSIGYEGFSQMQGEVWQSLLPKQYTLQLHEENRNRLKEVDPSNATGLLHEVFKEDILHIQKTLESTSSETFRKVVTALNDAKNIMVIGHRMSFAPAYWLSFALNLLRGNTKLLRNDTDDIVQVIADLNPDWTVVAFSFKRYTKETVDFVKLAKSTHANVISITDDLLAPISRFSDLVLPVFVNGGSTLRAMPSVYSLLNAIITGISLRNSQQISNKLSTYEKAFEKIYGHDWGTHSEQEG